ncbi:hypothetical protein HERIO_1165 [Hepatospora eriocheir]|uniref:Uncharacterized protein n=1 Tax=Hepatospora eriocheir TaxID=1081669 RepID=A0A1X0QAW6_9MICR|nr:hypothetical protein HERIO_1165 [Hepatospora eriocheir]
MGEKSYKTIRILSQLLATVVIVFNIYIITLNAYNYRLRELEKRIMKENNIVHFDTSILVVGMNLIVLIFGNFTVTTKSKCLIETYCSFIYYYNIFIALFCAYILSLYKIDFASKASQAIRPTDTTNTLLRTHFNENPNGNVIFILKNYMFELYNWTCLGHVLTLCINYFNMFLFSYILSMKLKKSRTRQTTQNHTAGMTDDQLKVRRAVQLTD